MEVEYRDKSGIYYPATISQIGDNKLYLKSKDDTFPSDWYSFNDCRYVRNPTTKRDASPGDLIDAYVKAKKGYQRARVGEIKGQFMVVEPVEEPSKEVIIPIDAFRFADQVEPLNETSFKKTTLALPDDLLNNVTDVCNSVCDSIPNIFAQYDEKQKALVIYTLDMKTVRRINVASEMLISQAKQKVSLIQKREEITKKLEQTSISSKVVVEFSVPQDLMGLAIGTEGSNIKAAREIEGVTAINIDESHENESVCFFKIYADNMDAADSARALLEYLTDAVPVPSDMVGKIIGKGGKTIQDIVDKAGVIRVTIGEVPSEEKNMVDFFFTGTKEAISLAEMLIEIHIKHVKEMESIRESIDETQRLIYNSNDTNGSFYRRGFQPRGGSQSRPNRYSRNDSFMSNGNSSSRIQSPPDNNDKNTPPPSSQITNGNGNHNTNGNGHSSVPPEAVETSNQAENGRGGGKKPYRGGFDRRGGRGNRGGKRGGKQPSEA